MQLVNLTPHVINISTPQGGLAIEPSGKIARIETQDYKIGIVEIDGKQISMYLEDEENIIDLPLPKKGVLYIVSRVVRDKTNRIDLYSPKEFIRDDKGKIIGCMGLVRR